jgi:hypothetical protein
MLLVISQIGEYQREYEIVIFTFRAFIMIFDMDTLEKVSKTSISEEKHLYSTCIKNQY